MIYIIFFMASFIFCSIGERLIKNGKKKKSRIYFGLSVIIVSFLAGVRDFTIGTDIMTYGHWMFLGAERSDNIISYIINSTNEVELLYKVFVYVVSVFFNNEHWLYFWTGFFIYSFTLAGFVKLGNSCSIAWTWLTYLFLLYGDTLNAMRQCMALAIIVFSFSFLLSCEYKKYIVLSLIAILFHGSAIFSFGIFIIYLVLKKNHSIFINALIVIAVLCVLVLYGEIINLFVDIGLLNEKFNRYASATSMFNSLNPLLIRVPFVLIIVLFYKSFSRESIVYRSETNKGISNKVYANFLIIMIIIEIMFALMRNVNVTLHRTSFYFCIFRCVGVGVLVDKVSKSNKVILKGGFLIFLVVYWIYQNVIQGNNEIYPFTSELLGIS